MPTYRSITLATVSQFDILNIPEYPPPKNPKDPFSDSPTLLVSDKGVASVYIPTYPNSRFWLCYSISPPYPPKAFYYFKLYLNGVCVQSWGCGEEDKYKGKTMFGVFDSGEVFFGERAVEKRNLCFVSEESAEKKVDKVKDFIDSSKDVMEVKVFRSKGRKRIRPEMEPFVHVAAAKISELKKSREAGGGGVSLVHAGLLPSRAPQRYYKYALLDPLDQPFATFRYYYRSVEQLEHLGIRPTRPSTNSTYFLSSSLKRPTSPALESVTTTSSSSTTISTSSNSNDAESSSAPQTAISLNSISKVLHILRPASPGPESFRSSSPSKNPIDLTPRPPSTITQAHFANLIRTFSPSKGHRPPTPTPGSARTVRRSGSMGVLMDVVGSAMRRRGRSVNVEREIGSSVERMRAREEELLPNDEIFLTMSKDEEEGEGGETSGEREAKVANDSGDTSPVTAGQPSVDIPTPENLGEVSTAPRKSTDGTHPAKTSSESESGRSSVLQERVDRTDKVKRRDLYLWEKLSKKHSSGHGDGVDGG